MIKYIHQSFINNFLLNNFLRFKNVKYDSFSCFEAENLLFSEMKEIFKHNGLDETEKSCHYNMTRFLGD